MRYHNVVEEMQIDFTNVFDVALRLFQPGRKLKPAVRAKQAQAVESVRDAKLLVHVIRATDVPLRLSYYKEYESYLAADPREQQKLYHNLYSSKQVEPLVEVRLVDPEAPENEQVRKTSAADGRSPEWNQILEFGLTAKDNEGFTKQELERSTTMVCFTLFDQEKQVEQITRARSQHYLEHKYLGRFVVPLTTVLAGQKLEGLVRVDRPVVLQSHKVIADEFIPMDVEQYRRDQGPRDEEQIPTYLNVTMSLEPFIQIETSNE